MKLARDVNGNKILKISCGYNRGFSIQTLGNLPKTHQMTNNDLDRVTAIGEAMAYVRKYGTKRQKELLDV